MKAAQFNKYGGPEVIEINPDAKKPVLKEGQVLVEVYGAGLNPVETSIREGHVQQMLTLEFPANAGGDFSGIVSEVGEGVNGFKPGDEVYGVANQFKGGSGSIAEFVASNAVSTGPKPKSIDHEKAAALPLVGSSAIQALEEHIKLKSGQKILIHGGAGGVGSVAIQLAKHIGAYVATTVSKADEDFVKQLGADRAIDYHSEDFEEILKDFDAVFDNVGGETAKKSFKVLKPEGILVSMVGGADEELAKEFKVTAINQGTKASTEQLARLARLVDDGVIKPEVAKVFPLEEASKAFEHFEKDHPQGKVVIKIK